MVPNSAKDVRTYKSLCGFDYWTLQPRDKPDFNEVTKRELEALINAPTEQKQVEYIEHGDWVIFWDGPQNERSSVWKVKHLKMGFSLTVGTITKEACCWPNACLGMDSERPLENILYDIVEKVDGKVLLSGEALELWRDFPFTAILNAAMHKG